jgi:hypothetical protein
MIARLSAVAAWLTVGHAVLFGLFWLLLSVPESNVTMLLVSVLVLTAMAVVFGVVEGGGLLAWDSSVPAKELPRRSLRALPPAWLGTLLFVLVRSLVGILASLWQEHRGEIDAWLMTEIGRADNTRLHTVMGWVFAFGGNVVGLSLALSLATSVLRGGVGQAGRLAWLREALSPRRLLIVTGILLIFLWLPWKGADWRPGWLEPNWQETVFVVAKLGVLFVVANIGWALFLGAARPTKRV